MSLRRLLLLGCLVAGFRAEAIGRMDFSESTYIVQPTRLWTEPSKFGEAIAVLEPGLKIEILTYSTNEGWMKIRTPSGREGWVAVRVTAMSGRREEPLVPREKEDGPKPASEGEAAPDESLPVEKNAGPAKEEEPLGFFMGAAEYANQLSRDHASGFGLHLGAVIAINAHFGAGIGLDWNYFSESAQSEPASVIATGVNAYVNRKTNRFFPHLLGRAEWGDFGFDLGLGLDVDHTAIQSIDLNTGAEIPTITDSGGNTYLVTGSDSRLAFGFSLAPSYLVTISPGFKLGAYLNYSIVFEPSSGAGSVGFAVSPEPTSRYSTTLAGGLMLRAHF